MSNITYKKLDEPNYMRDKGLTFKKIIGENQEFLLRQTMKEFDTIFQTQELAYFHHNIRNLKIKSKKPRVFKNAKLVKNDEKEVCYKPITNVLYIGDNINKKDLARELLKLASTTKYSALRRFTGFKYKHHFYILGDGINKGYIDLLCGRYFSEEEETTVEQKYARCIEDIIGKYDMGFHFFTGNLKGLMRELRNYFDYDEIVDFLINVDCISKIRNKDKINDKEIKKIERAFKDANEFIARAYDKKLSIPENESNRELYFEHFCDLTDSEFLIKKIYPDSNNIISLNKARNK